jgi:glycine betaine catabolism A
MNGKKLYLDNGLFEIEWESILKQQWIFIALVSDFPSIGDRRSYQILNENFFLVRSNDGVRAFHNICPHRGSKICLDERINSSSIECPYHRWKFDLNGRRESARGMSDCDSATDLKPIKIKIKWGLIFISFSAKDSVLDEKFVLFDELFESYNIESTSVVEEYVTLTKTNWKLFIENFLECYHCAPNHPQLRSMEKFIDDYENSFVLRFDAVPKLRYLKGLHVFDWTSKMPAFARIAKLKDGILSETQYGNIIGSILGAAEHKLTYVIYGMFGPFLHFTLNADHAVFFTFIPVDVNTTKVTVRWCMADHSNNSNSELTWLWKNTIQQDIDLTEAVQKNAASDYFPRPKYHQLEGDAKLFMLWHEKQIKNGFHELRDENGILE